jgi:poly-beta-1,6-N-acetyl-D-glucosamine biosynthesis protein PgaD
MEDWRKKMHKQRFDDLIINRPQSMRKIRRRMEISATTIGWVIWLFVCRPLFIILLWLIGFQFFYEHMINLGGLAGLKEQWIAYIIVILLIYIVVRGWNVYNKVRYGKKNRRKATKETTPEEMDKFFQFSENSCQLFQKARRISIDFTKGGQIEVRDPGQPDPNIRKGRFQST